MSEKIKLGVSTCLLGENVRYDGQHKHDLFITDTLGKYVQFLPVCPEVECGLPIPRESMRLVGDPAAPRLMTHNTGRDITGQMTTWMTKRLKELEKENLCGFIFKSKSPSSGMERVKVYNGKGSLSGRAPGLFAKAFMDQFPLLPVEDEGRLNDPEIRENFIERIFTLNRYRDTVQNRKQTSALVKFHAEHKFLLMSHSETHCREMGRLVANSGRSDQPAYDNYEKLLLSALSLKATTAKHINVLQHMMGFLKELLSGDEKKEMAELLSSFRRSEIPLIVPVTLMNHYVRKYKIAYLEDQYYLSPHPLEMKLRNHA